MGAYDKAPQQQDDRFGRFVAEYEFRQVQMPGGRLVFQYKRGEGPWQTPRIIEFELITYHEQQQLVEANESVPEDILRG